MANYTLNILKELIDADGPKAYFGSQRFTGHLDYLVNKGFIRKVNLFAYEITPAGRDEYYRLFAKQGVQPVVGQVEKINWSRIIVVSLFFLSTVYFGLLWYGVTWLFRPTWLPAGLEEPATVILGAVFGYICFWKKW